MLYWKTLRSDSRYFQIIGQSIFLFSGIFLMGWSVHLPLFLLAISSSVAFQMLAIHFGLAQPNSLRSALITGLGLSLLLRVNHPLMMVTAAALAIGQKFVFKYKGYHFWNPANFGIAVLVLLSDQAWISPAQWDHHLWVVGLIVLMGLLVLKSAQRWDTALFFGATLGLLCWIRFSWYLGWEWRVWWHQFNMGSFWLYTMFMITDPMTTPQRRWVRRVWAVFLGILTFYLQHFKFIPTAAVWSLLMLTPLVPFINRFFPTEQWKWIK
jgi:Na+-transporting NADH:ubiquinone oxidoreductase subunit NqrB